MQKLLIISIVSILVIAIIIILFVKMFNDKEKNQNVGNKIGFRFQSENKNLNDLIQNMSLLLNEIKKIIRWKNLLKIYGKRVFLRMMH